MEQGEVPQNEQEQDVHEGQRTGLTLPPRNPDMNRLFRLSDQERQWALDLKSAVESANDLQNLSDLQYVQFVLAFHGDLEVTLDRVRGMEAFRREYNINDTFEEGMAIVREFARQHPGTLLSFAYDDATENYGMIYDRSCMNHSILDSEDRWRTFLGGAYYIMAGLVPDPYSMRQGIFFIAECQGTDSTRMNGDVLRQVWYHLLYHMPIFFRSIKFFHTNMVTNISYALMKPFMRADVKDRIVLGCQFGCNLSTLYLLPTPEISTERSLQRLEGFMKQRYVNQATFSLC